MGGGIDFGEMAEAAVRRDLREELDVELLDERLLGVLENLFHAFGRYGHEIVFVYDCRFADQSNGTDLRTLITSCHFSDFWQMVMRRVRRPTHADPEQHARPGEHGQLKNWKSGRRRSERPQCERAEQEPHSPHHATFPYRCSDSSRSSAPRRSRRRRGPTSCCPRPHR